MGCPSLPFSFPVLSLPVCLSFLAVVTLAENLLISPRVVRSTSVTYQWIFKLNWKHFFSFSFQFIPTSFCLYLTLKYLTEIAGVKIISHSGSVVILQTVLKIHHLSCQGASLQKIKLWQDTVRQRTLLNFSHKCLHEEAPGNMIQRLGHQNKQTHKRTPPPTKPPCKGCDIIENKSIYMSWPILTDLKIYPFKKKIHLLKWKIEIETKTKPIFNGR